MTSTVSTHPAPALTTEAPSALPVCAADVSSPEFMDPPCEESFDSYGEQDFATMDQDDTTCSVWQLLSTIYLPILFLRLRRTLSGFCGLVRSILFGQCLRFLVTYLAPTNWESLSPWIQTVLGTSEKSDPHAWPPPTLRILAILTIFAFIVHPDGMTWIMLGKLRDGIVTFLRSSTTCWNIVVEDYGIVPTLFALTTFASLLFVVFVLHRTLTPKTPKHMMAPERSKKKKRKNMKGGRGRIRGRKQHAESSKRRVEEPVSCEKPESFVSCEKTEFLPKELTTQQPSRPRIPTADTALMDDQSCESESVPPPVSSRPPAAVPCISAPAPSPPGPKTAKEGKKATRTPNRRRTCTKTKGKKSKPVDTPSRPETSRPPATSPPTVLSRPGRPRSLRAANQNAHARPSERLRHVSSPDDSLFSTPLSSPTHTSSRMPPAARAPTVGMMTPLSPPSSLFSHEPVVSSASCSIPAARYPSPVGPTVNVPYRTHSHAGLYSSPEKIELAAFLSQAGLVGTAHADLLEALDDVAALWRLSDAQFELYNVSPEEKIRIDLMLAARRRTPATIRPPPGLPTDPMLMSSPHQPTQVTTATESSSNNLCYPSRSFGQTPIGGNTQMPALSMLSPYEMSNNSLCCEAEEEIEAELQELGGQMVGSILDFDS